MRDAPGAAKKGLRAHAHLRRRDANYLTSLAPTMAARQMFPDVFSGSGEGTQMRMAKTHINRRRFNRERRAWAGLWRASHSCRARSCLTNNIADADALGSACARSINGCAIVKHPISLWRRNRHNGVGDAMRKR